jgi:hypothetical protein
VKKISEEVADEIAKMHKNKMNNKKKSKFYAAIGIVFKKRNIKRDDWDEMVSRVSHILYPRAIAKRQSLKRKKGGQGEFKF